MGKYRKIPIVIDAVQWFPLPEQPVEGVITPITSAQAKGFGLSVAERHGHGIVKTLEGPHLVRPGDWIITGIEGEKYSCKDSVFQKSYEAVLDSPSNQSSKQAEEDETAKQVRDLERDSVPFAIAIGSDPTPPILDLLPEETEDYSGGGGTFGGGGSSSSWESDDRSTSDTPSDNSSDSASDSCSSDSSSSSDSCSSDSGSSGSD